MRAHPFHRIARRYTAVVALAAYLLPASGVPIATRVAKDTSRPFPCQDRPCGCQNAEECWRHCCCFTAEQRLAWAVAHHVEPPADADPIITAGWRSGRFPDGSPILALAEPECHCPACEADGDQGQCTACHRQESAQEGAGALELSALRCRGPVSIWLSTGAVTPVPIFPRWAPELHLVDQIVIGDIKPRARRTTPPDPPPRVTMLRIDL